MRILTKIDPYTFMICLLLIYTLVFTFSVQGQEFALIDPIVNCDNGQKITYQGRLLDDEGNLLPAGAYTLDYCWLEEDGTLIFCCSTDIDVDENGFFKTELSDGVKPTLGDDIIIPTLVFRLFTEFSIEGEVITPQTEILWSNRSVLSTRLFGDGFSSPGRLVMTDINIPGSAAVAIQGKSDTASIAFFPSNIGGKGLGLFSNSTSSGMLISDPSNGNSHLFINNNIISLFSANIEKVNFSPEGMFFNNGTLLTQDSLMLTGFNSSISLTNSNDSTILLFGADSGVYRGGFTLGGSGTDGSLVILNSGGTMLANIDSGRASFGIGHTNTGDNGFVAGKDGIASGLQSSVGGGMGCTASGNRSVVAGGHNCSAEATTSSVGGGFQNHATGTNSRIGGGHWNQAANADATVGGGYLNIVTGWGATISGGNENTVSGNYSTVPGGKFNAATGQYSFAAGKRAKANHNGSFVWADNTGTDFASTATDQFSVRARGGVRIATDSTFSAGVILTSGASAWSAVSDSALKRNIREVDYQGVLEKVAALPISQWSYEAQDESIEHIGPMAQDFYRLFGLGEDDKHISTLDPDGVSLAAIKALIVRNNELESEMAELKELVEKLISAQK